MIPRAFLKYSSKKKMIDVMIRNYLYSQISKINQDLCQFDLELDLESFNFENLPMRQFKKKLI